MIDSDRVLVAPVGERGAELGRVAADQGRVERDLVVPAGGLAYTLVSLEKAAP